VRGYNIRHAIVLISKPGYRADSSVLCCTDNAPSITSSLQQLVLILFFSSSGSSGGGGLRQRHVLPSIRTRRAWPLQPLTNFLREIR